MTNRQALQRALNALERAYMDSDYFDHGGLASNEIAELIAKSLKAEFGTPDQKLEYRKYVLSSD